MSSTSTPGWPGEVIEVLATLVRTPSVHPDGDPGTSPENIGEGKMAARVGELLTELGAAVRFDEVRPDRPNVIGEFPSDASTKPRLLFAPHLDTVTVAGMTIDPFAAEIRDGRLYGRGASDTKGTMAAMLQAFRELGTEAIATLPYEIHFVGLMSEESGQLGSKDFGKRYAGQYELAVVGEPTNCKVVHTHKGCSWLRLTVGGKSAHASIPKTGENAIAKMAQIVLALEGTFREDLAAVDDDEWLGTSSVSVGQIEGGVRANVVPDHCSAIVDIRSTPALDRHGGAEGFLRAWLGKTHPEIAVKIETVSTASPLPIQSGPLVDALSAVGGGLTSAPWFCDAAFLAAEGIPAVAAGPGSIAQAHTADEWIDLDELRDGVAFYRRFLESL